MGSVGTGGCRFAGDFVVTLAGIVGMCAIILGTISFWAACKFLAVEFDRVDAWDLADFAAGALGGLGVFALQVGLQEFRPGATGGLPHWTFALREGAMVAYGLALGFWMASAWLEDDLDVDVPDGLDPMADRIWEIHLGWVPFIGRSRRDG